MNPELNSENLTLERPVVYNYRSSSEFLSDLMKYYKANGTFSLRQRTSKTNLISQALVSQILIGKRQLNRDNLTSIASIFKLTQIEQDYLDKKLLAQNHKLDFIEDAKKNKKDRVAKNYLLSDWINPYVKDLVHLKNFKLDADTIFFMLQGIAPMSRIKKSIDFLIKESFWRTTIEGKIVQDDPAVVTTSGIPNEKIKNFHRKALEIAARGLKVFPITQRKASTVLISVNNENMDELKGLLNSFEQQLLNFIEKYPEGSDSLIQITTHLTPIGRSE